MKKKKRKLKLRDEVKDVIAVIMLFIVAVGGVVLINARFEQINESNTKTNTMEINK